MQWSIVFWQVTIMQKNRHKYILVPLKRSWVNNLNRSVQQFEIGAFENDVQDEAFGETL